MIVAMTSKNQITLPKRIVEALRLRRGSRFNIKVHQNRINLIPLKNKMSEFTEEEYAKLEKLYRKEKSVAKKVTEKFIREADCSGKLL